MAPTYKSKQTSQKTIQHQLTIVQRWRKRLLQIKVEKRGARPRKLVQKEKHHRSPPIKEAKWARFPIRVAFRPRSSRNICPKLQTRKTTLRNPSPRTPNHPKSILLRLKTPIRRVPHPLHQLPVPKTKPHRIRATKFTLIGAFCDGSEL